MCHENTPGTALLLPAAPLRAAAGSSAGARGGSLPPLPAPMGWGSCCLRCASGRGGLLKQPPKDTAALQMQSLSGLMVMVSAEPGGCCSPGEHPQPASSCRPAPASISCSCPAACWCSLRSCGGVPVKTWSGWVTPKHEKWKKNHHLISGAPGTL